MERLFDRLILMICCGVVLMVNNVNIYTSVTVIIAVTLVSVNIAFDYMKVHGAVYILYLLLTFFAGSLYISRRSYAMISLWKAICIYP